MDEIALGYNGVRLAVMLIFFAWAVTIVWRAYNLLKDHDVAQDAGEDIYQKWWKGFHELVRSVGTYFVVLIGCLIVMSFLIPVAPKFSTRKPAPPTTIDYTGPASAPWVKNEESMTAKERLEYNRKLFDSNAIKPR